MTTPTNAPAATPADPANPATPAEGTQPATPATPAAAATPANPANPGEQPGTPAATPAAPAAAQPAAPAANEPAQPAAPATPAAAEAGDWRSGITDPALKNIADRLTSPVDAIKSIQDLRTQNSQMIRVPDENASDEDRAKFNKALGVPETPEGYLEQMQLPEGVELTDADKAVLEKILPAAHEAGAPAAVMSKIVSHYMGVQKEMIEQVTTQLNQFQADAQADLKREWGPDYEPNLNLANRTAEVFGGPEFKAFLNETPLPGGGMLGDHPVMAKMLATLGRRSGEGELLLGSTPEAKQNAQAELDRLNKEVPPGSAGYTDPAHQAKVSALYDQIYGRSPVVGSTGRAA